MSSLSQSSSVETRGALRMGHSLSVCFGRTLVINDVKNCSNPDCDPDLKPSSSRELEHLIDRLERIVDRLERTVSARELEETRRILKGVCDAGKAVVSVTDEATGTDEDEKLLDSNSNSDLPTVLPSTPPPSASYLHQQLDSLEATLFPELNSVEPTAAKDQPQVDHSLDTLPTVIAQY